MVNDNNNFTTNQGDFFQQLNSCEPEYLAANAPDLDIEQELLGAITYAIRASKKRGLTRDRIVERMNMCLPDDLKVTKRQLDAWTAESQEYKRFPVIFLPAFIWATGGIISPLEILTRALGLHVLDENEQLAADLGKAAMAKVNAAKMEREIKRKLER